MNKFTKEQLIEQAKWVRENLAPLIKSADADHSETMAKNDRLMEIALAALTAPPFGFTEGDKYGMCYEPRHADRLQEPVPVYRTPTQSPPPAGYHDADCVLLKPQEVKGIFTPRACDCGAALRQGKADGPFISEGTRPAVLKDHQIRDLVNELRDVAVDYHGTQSLRERIARTVRAAMLQLYGKTEQLEPVSQHYRLPANSFTNQQLEGMSHGDNPQANAYRELLAYRRGAPASTAGWVVVPIEPTEDMVIAGFEAELREEFRDPDAWEAFEAMSGCEQAALRAKWCWAAMIAAAPQQEVRSKIQAERERVREEMSMGARLTKHRFKP